MFLYSGSRSKCPSDAAWHHNWMIARQLKPWAEFVASWVVRLFPAVTLWTSCPSFEALWSTMMAVAGNEEQHRWQTCDQQLSLDQCLPIDSSPIQQPNPGCEQRSTESHVEMQARLGPCLRFLFLFLFLFLFHLPQTLPRQSRKPHRTAMCSKSAQALYAT